MNKDVDNFVITVLHIIHRFISHKDGVQFKRELNSAYDSIKYLENIDDFSDIYIGPLFIHEVYRLQITTAITNIISTLLEFKTKIYESDDYVPKDTIEIARQINNEYSGKAIYGLSFLFGEKIFKNRGLMYRMLHIKTFDITEQYDYSNSILQNDKLEQVPYAVPILREIFCALATIRGESFTSKRSYSIAEVFVSVFNDSTLPVHVPLNLSWYSVAKKKYLRYIMHHPNDTRYVSTFKDLYHNSDRFCKRAICFFAWSMGGDYAKIVKDDSPSSPLVSWYKKEISDKQLDSAFDEFIKEERKTFEELLSLGIGIAIDANIRLTKRRFAMLKKYIDSHYISKYKDLAGPFIVRDSSMLACKILRRQIND